MDLNRVLAELIRERDLLDKAIANLEQLSAKTRSIPVSRPKVTAPKRAERAQVAGAGMA